MRLWKRLVLKFGVHLLVITATGILISYLVYPSVSWESHIAIQQEYFLISIGAAALVSWISEKYKP